MVNKYAIQYFREAFNFLLQYIYGFSLDYKISADQLFEILNLAERWKFLYQKTIDSF